MDRRSLRRAALRGAMSAALAAVAARLLRRPDLSAVAVSSAAATGAAQEAAVGVVPGGALVAVAAARAGGRHRTPVEIGTAVALGAAVAASTRALWPVAPGRPAEVLPTRRTELEPLPGGRGLVIAVNPSAGSSGSELASALEEALPAATIELLDDPADLAPVLAEAALRDGTCALGVAGGDGTINVAAEVAHQHGLPLAVVPAGTLNHLARDLGIDRLDDVVEAVEAGTVAMVDLPTIAGRRFLNTASFGSYAELVDAREALEDRIGKWPALVVALIRVLRHGTPVEVELDGRCRSLWMVFIGSCAYEPAGFAPSWRPRLDDGALDVRLVDARHPFCRTRLVAALLTGQLGRSRVYDRWCTTQVVVRSADGPLRLACDGETFDAEDVEDVEDAVGAGSAVGEGVHEVIIAKDGARVGLFTPAR